ncbi:hypothetical protein Esti_006114 [Eimeria stiedai]
MGGSFSSTFRACVAHPPPSPSPHGTPGPQSTAEPSTAERPSLSPFRDFETYTRDLDLRATGTERLLHGTAPRQRPRRPRRPSRPPTATRSLRPARDQPKGGRGTRGQQPDDRRARHEGAGEQRTDYDDAGVDTQQRAAAPAPGPPAQGHPSGQAHPCPPKTLTQMACLIRQVLGSKHSGCLAKISSTFAPTTTGRRPPTRAPHHHRQNPVPAGLPRVDARHLLHPCAPSRQRGGPPAGHSTPV